MKICDPPEPPKHYCKFCGYHEKERELMIVSGDLAKICSQCVEICAEVLKDFRERKQAEVTTPRDDGR